MGFYAGDTYNFILNISAPAAGVTTVTSAPVITVLDILNPGSPIVSGAAMTLIAGTSFVYFYSFSVPNATPKDYIGIYSYAVENDQNLGTATAATWSGGVASYTFPLPLPANAVAGNLLTTTGFTSGGPGNFNVTNASVLSVDQTTGVIKVAMVTDPGTESVLGTGKAIADTTVSNQLISDTDKLHIGDTFVTGQVALDATVAKNSTVAKDATVMKSAQYTSPSNDPVVQGINTTVASLLADVTGLVTLLGSLGAGSISDLIQDIYDGSFGGISIDQTVNPPVMTITRVNGSAIASFQLINNPSATQRVVVTHPPESGI